MWRKRRELSQGRGSNHGGGSGDGYGGMMVGASRKEEAKEESFSVGA